MATITQGDSLQQLRDTRDRWLRDNRGVLAEIASKLGVAHGTVRSVYHGATRRSTTGDIERELSKAGAPGFAAAASKIDNSKSSKKAPAA